MADKENLLSITLELLQEWYTNTRAYIEASSSISNEKMAYERLDIECGNYLERIRVAEAAEIVKEYEGPTEPEDDEEYSSGWNS